MTSSRKVDSDKAAKYAIAASKGFSYYLPKSAQRHLQELRKQIPSAARSIYDEYYRDLMCAKACAPESAAAMTRFVTSSFPKIARKHNAFAREINEEIDINEHEGYEPIKFPIVAEPGVDDEEVLTVAKRGKKRKRAPAASSPPLNREVTPQKKAKTKSDTNPAANFGSATTSPSSSPGLTARSHADATPDDAEPEVGTPTPPSTEDVQYLTPDSVRFADNNRDSRYSSPLSDVPSSAQLSGEDEVFEERAERPNADEQDPLQGQHDVTADLIEGHDQEDILSPRPSQALLRSRDDGFTTGPGGFDAKPEMEIDHDTLRESPAMTMSPPTSSSLVNIAAASNTEVSTLEKESEDGTLSSSITRSNYNSMSEEERWEDGMQAIEDFDWDRKGSQWLIGRGLVSNRYEHVGRSARLLEGNRWNNTEAEHLFPGIDEGLHVMGIPMDLADHET